MYWEWLNGVSTDVVIWYAIHGWYPKTIGVFCLVKLFCLRQTFHVGARWSLVVLVGADNCHVLPMNFERSKGVSAKVEDSSSYQKCHAATQRYSEVLVSLVICVFALFFLQISTDYLILDKDSIDPDACLNWTLHNNRGTLHDLCHDGTSILMSSCHAEILREIPPASPQRKSSKSSWDVLVLWTRRCRPFTWSLGWNKNRLTPCKGWIDSTIRGTDYR